MSDKETPKTPHPPAKTPQPIREDRHNNNRGIANDSMPVRESVEKMQRPAPWPPPPPANDE